MNKAHKYPCGDKSCPQTFCMSDRIRQDQNMENCKEIDRLTAQVKSLTDALADHHAEALSREAKARTKLELMAQACLVLSPKARERVLAQFKRLCDLPPAPSPDQGEQR